MPLTDSKLSRAFINLLILIAGPLASIWLAVKNKGGTVANWWPLILVTVLFTVLTAIIASAIYLSRKTVEGSVKRSTVYSIAIYLVIAICGTVFFDPAGIMWLPIAIPFMMVLSIPMALFVSLGTIRILKDMKIVDNTLEDTTKEAEKRLREFVDLSGVRCSVFSIAADDLNPGHCVFWVTLKADTEKEKVLNMNNLETEFLNILRSVGYPANAIQHVRIEIESQETVDRDYIGNWWQATRMKKDR